MAGRSLSDLMSYENPPNLSETITKWGALAKAHIPQRVGRAEFPYMHKYISVYAKNISAYTKINRRIYASLSAHIRLFGILLSPVVWGGKRGVKEHYHLDKSDRPRTVSYLRGEVRGRSLLGLRRSGGRATSVRRVHGRP